MISSEAPAFGVSTLLATYKHGGLDSYSDVDTTRNGTWATAVSLSTVLEITLHQLCLLIVNKANFRSKYLEDSEHWHLYGTGTFAATSTSSEANMVFDDPSKVAQNYELQNKSIMIRYLQCVSFSCFL